MTLENFPFQTTPNNFREVGKALSRIQQKLLKDNFNATANPAVTDDAGDGYEIGSVWINVTADTQYICVDATIGAAVWLLSAPAGGAATGVFQTINCPSGTDPVADSTSDTLNLAAGTGITITGDETTDTVTIAATGSASSFSTIDCPAGTDPVADAAADTLVLASANAGLTITGNSGTDTVTFAVVPGSGGVGDVIGPASSVDGSIPFYDGTTGKLLDSAANMLLWDGNDIVADRLETGGCGIYWGTAGDPYAHFSPLFTTDPEGLELAARMSGSAIAADLQLSADEDVILNPSGIARVGADEIVTLAASQTLTNKTLTAPVIADFTNANHDHLDADDGGTLTLAAINNFGANVATFLGTPSSSNLAAAVTDETGTGALVFANTPTLVTPILGTPTSGDLLNCTYNVANTDTTITRASAGDIAVEGNRVFRVGGADVPVADGGTGASTLTGLLQGNGTSAFTAITDSSTVGQVLRVTGASTYAWGAVNLADTDAVTGLLPQANVAKTGTVIARVIRSMPPATTYAQLVSIAGGSSPVENVHALAFDASIIEYMDYLCELSPQYQGGGLTVRLGWTTASTTSAASPNSETRWEAGIRAFPDDAEAINSSHDYATNGFTNNFVDATAPSTAQEIIYDNIVIASGTNMDSLAAGETFILRIRRNATHANDDSAGDSYLISISIRET